MQNFNTNVIKIRPPRHADEYDRPFMPFMEICVLTETLKRSLPQTVFCFRASEVLYKTTVLGTDVTVCFLPYIIMM
jgi:hypothetical protein